MIDQKESVLENYIEVMGPAVENEMAASIARGAGEGLEAFYYMMAYHLGWEGEDAGSEARGKRIRPLLVLLSAAATGGNWENALPAAASVELLHNFSLIHDDIEDNSPLRRGRPAVWVRWGIPQAINVGDAMFTIAHLSILRLADTVSPEIALKASNALLETSLQLTKGQYLDISYEKRSDLSEDAYWPMIRGKTASLIGACTLIGAYAAQANETTCQAYKEFGESLGLAFQALDDLLGIWGDEALIGKSAKSDLLSGKKSLPVLFGLSLDGEFAERWRQGPIKSNEAVQLAQILEKEGARTYTQTQANMLTQNALNALEQANPQGAAGQALQTLAHKLLQRQA